ncbi:MAG TPA: hypothetical protein VM008_12465 [Phycisphaerae bacterium]|nr:hypothetical protein [Phycisphaerae bacterium]
MTTTELEHRLAALEKKVEMLAARNAPTTNKEWLLNIWGSFSGDPDFEKAMRLGKQWRQAENRKSLRSTRPSHAKKRRR